MLNIGEDDEDNATLIWEDPLSGFALLLGNKAAAMDLPYLQLHNVKYVVNSTKRTPMFFPTMFSSMRVAIDDTEEESIEPYLECTYNFISKAREDGVGVLVYCEYGMSRSVSIVLAYLMRSEKLSLVEAFDVVQQLRPLSSPNPAFMEQLLSYEETLFHTAPSLSLELYRDDRFMSAGQLSCDESSFEESLTSSISSSTSELLRCGAFGSEDLALERQYSLSSSTSTIGDLEGLDGEEMHSKVAYRDNDYFSLELP